MSATLKPTRKLTLSPNQPLRQATIDGFGGILSYAVQMANSAQKDPERAVHEYRKSIRRARALLRMLQVELGQDYKELNGQLRELVKRTSGLRDLDVLDATLLALPEANKPKETRDREAILALIHDAKSKRQAIDIPALLQDDTDILQTMRFDLTQALPDDYGWPQLGQGMAATYKRAKRALNEAKHSADDDDIHDWRKRVKELRYQLELLSSRLDHAHIQGLHDRMDKLAEALGEVTDLIVLRDFVLDHQDELKKNPRRLLKTICALIEDKFYGCVADFSDLFDEGSKTFSRQLLVTVLPVPAHHHAENEGEEE